MEEVTKARYLFGDVDADDRGETDDMDDMDDMGRRRAEEETKRGCEESERGERTSMGKGMRVKT